MEDGDDHELRGLRRVDSRRSRNRRDRRASRAVSCSTSSSHESESDGAETVATHHHRGRPEDDDEDTRSHVDDDGSNSCGLIRAKSRSSTLDPEGCGSSRFILEDADEWPSASAASLASCASNSASYFDHNYVPQSGTLPSSSILNLADLLVAHREDVALSRKALEGESGVMGIGHLESSVGYDASFPLSSVPDSVETFMSQEGGQASKPADALLTLLAQNPELYHQIANLLVGGINPPASPFPIGTFGIEEEHSTPWRQKNSSPFEGGLPVTAGRLVEEQSPLKNHEHFKFPKIFDSELQPVGAESAARSSTAGRCWDDLSKDSRRLIIGKAFSDGDDAAVQQQQSVNDHDAAFPSKRSLFDSPQFLRQMRTPALAGHRSGPSACCRPAARAAIKSSSNDSAALGTDWARAPSVKRSLSANATTRTAWNSGQKAGTIHSDILANKSHNQKPSEELRCPNFRAGDGGSGLCMLALQCASLLERLHLELRRNTNSAGDRCRCVRDILVPLCQRLLVADSGVPSNDLRVIRHDEDAFSSLYCPERSSALPPPPAANESSEGAQEFLNMQVAALLASFRTEESAAPNAPIVEETAKALVESSPCLSQLLANNNKTMMSPYPDGSRENPSCLDLGSSLSQKVVAPSKEATEGSAVVSTRNPKSLVMTGCSSGTSPDSQLEQLPSPASSSKSDDESGDELSQSHSGTATVTSGGAREEQLKRRESVVVSSNSRNKTTDEHPHRCHRSNQLLAHPLTSSEIPLKCSEGKLIGSSDRGSSSKASPSSIASSKGCSGHKPEFLPLPNLRSNHLMSDLTRRSAGNRWPRLQPQPRVINATSDLIPLL